MPSRCLLQTEIPGIPARRGKVRDAFDLGNALLLVATDRISAFDWVLPTGIPGKGRLLTQISLFWFQHLGGPHHLLTADVDAMDLPPQTDREALRGRSMLCRKARVVPFECVVRGYLAGSGWNEYRASGEVCGEPLPAGLVESSALPRPIFTPATKAEQGEHDENVPFSRMVESLGSTLAESLRDRSIELYERGAALARGGGILIADSKFEFGLTTDSPGAEELILIDEALTPDSSRFWPADRYAPGGPQDSFDKQYVRDWLLGSGWNRSSPPPELPLEVVERTRAKYVEAYERLTGRVFDL